MPDAMQNPWQPPTRWSRLATNPSLLLVPLALALLVGPISERFFCDEGLWHYIAWDWVQNGVPPYQGAVENKTPGIFYLFAVSELIGGVNVWFPRAVGILATLSASLCVHRLVRSWAGRVPAACAMGLFGLGMAWRDLWGGFPAHTETFLVLFVLLGVLALDRARRTPLPRWRGPLLAVLAGIAFAWAVGFKQIAVTSVPPAALLSLWPLAGVRDGWGRRVGLFGLTVAGFGLGSLLTVLPLLLSGVSFGEYVEGAWLILLDPASSAPVLYARYERFVTAWFFEQIRWFYPLLLLFLLQLPRLRRRGVPVVWLLGWCAADFIGTNASGYLFGHQIRQMLPTFGMMAGLGLGLTLERLAHLRLDRERSIAAGMLLLLLLGWPWRMTRTTWHRLIDRNALPYQEEVAAWLQTGPGSVLDRWPAWERVTQRMAQGRIAVPYQREIATWLRTHTDPADEVYIFSIDGQVIQALSRRRSPSRYIFGIFLSSLRPIREVEGDLLADPPAVILVSGRERHRVPPWLERIFEEGYAYRFALYGYDVWQRKGDAPAFTHPLREVPAGG